MGSFKVSCQVSHLTINEGDKVMFFPLVLSNYKTEVLKKQMFVSNTDLYEPFCLPIEGTYNDAGGITNIIENENTRILEKKYGMTINEFIKYICNNRYEKIKSNTENKLPKLHTMFILKEIYDEMSSIDVKEYGNDIFKKGTVEFIEIQKVNIEILKTLGFVFKEKGKHNSDKNRDCDIWIKDNNLVKISEYCLEIKDLINNISNVKIFIDSWKRIIGETLDIEKIKNISIIKSNICENIYYLNQLTVANKSIDNNTFIKFVSNIKVLIGDYTWDNFFNHYIDNIFIGNKLYNKKTNNEIEEKNYEEMLSLLEDFSYFNNNFVIANIVYFPTFHGTEEGMNCISELILNSSMKIVERRKKIILEELND